MDHKGDVVLEATRGPRQEAHWKHQCSVLSDAPAIPCQFQSQPHISIQQYATSPSNKMQCISHPFPSLPNQTHTIPPPWVFVQPPHLQPFHSPYNPIKHHQCCQNPVNPHLTNYPAPSENPWLIPNPIQSKALPAGLLERDASPDGPIADSIFQPRRGSQEGATIICTTPGRPANPRFMRWCSTCAQGHHSWSPLGFLPNTANKVSMGCPRSLKSTISTRSGSGSVESLMYNNSIELLCNLGRRKSMRSWEKSIVEREKFKLRMVLSGLGGQKDQVSCSSVMWWWKWLHVISRE